MNKKKITFLLSAAFSMIVLFSGTVFAYGWQSSGGRWWYGTNFDNSKYYSSGWQLIDRAWYYFDDDGWMVQDQWVGNYYLGSSGAMLTNAWTPDGYWVGSDGKWIAGRTPEKNAAWTGDYYIWNTRKTAVYGNAGQGIDTLEADRSHLHIKGYFRKLGDNKDDYLGYHDKTFNFASYCTFWESDGDEDYEQDTWREFYHELIKRDGRSLYLQVVDNLILRAMLSK
ncbi:MAG: hypothetical protein IJT43_06150 [Stomatobaculum sp.]|nr:hypothetical protein [Stomatobaculum sp.]